MCVVWGGGVCVFAGEMMILLKLSGRMCTLKNGWFSCTDFDGFNHFPCYEGVFGRGLL